MASHRIDWGGNITFGLGLILLLTAITYGIQPYGDQVMAWASPRVVILFALGIASLAFFVFRERRVPRPMMDFRLLGVAAFAYGNVANLAAAIARGGLQFMLIIWLQGIWLPLHGYPFEATPLWSAIFMLPLTVGFLLAGPLAGHYSDKIGGVPFAAGGMVLGAASFVLLIILPADFSYPTFATLLFANGLGSGPLRRAEQHADHERGAAARAWPGVGHARDEHQCGPSSFDRSVLQPDARRACGDPAACDGSGTRRRARAG